MIRHRLSWVLILLATTIVLQAVVAVFALREAQQQIVRGRIASDIHRGFVEMSATKQRLHTWVAQLTLGGGGDVKERDRLLGQMSLTLTQLQALTQAAADSSLASDQPLEQRQRQEALDQLSKTIPILQAATYQARPTPANLQAQQAWQALTQTFEYAGGQDLRQLISQSIVREQAAMERKRSAADQALTQIRLIWLGMAALLALLSLAAMVYFARALRRPLEVLTGGAQALAQGQWQHRISLRGKDEFALVATSMNGMAEKLEQHHLQEAAKRTQLEEQVKERTTELHLANESLRQTDVRRRQLLADISHELRTPTTAIRGEAEVTLRGASRTSEEYRDALGRIVQTSRELGAVIDDLLSMARTDLESLTLVREPIDMALPLADALAQAGALAAANGVRMVCEPPESVTGRVLADRQRLRQLLLLLLDNAIRYSHSGGTVTLHVSLQAARPSQPAQWRIVVADQGIGIPEDELPLIFQRHFRGQQAREHRASGSGLGLPIASSLAQAHGGKLSLSSQLNQGTQAELILPALAFDPSLPSGAAASPETPT
ncbi:HAMP domain-containing sensor histidine kinase [Variovorax sp. PCZ-1]|uniref:sensor histidine kinase n=1 Tax=Variovorax sp. PCZ-1 TaxID=2835533 RepID=UPI001BCB502B|nr:HAMP domain-containing sensor histidine kinase [Variovorax sp. PCZ-1]MBS7808733.1 HAMP domain-containing histidine kinase [Variovorax sp. PCZ-1]